MSVANTYLKPVIDAAHKMKVHLYWPERLEAILERLGQHPGDTISPLNALNRLANISDATPEELDILLKVFPDHSGSVRYYLTATTLEWQWSAKHSGRYARILMPFPTLLPMTITVERYCDMDDINNHDDECPQGYPDDDPGYSSDCNCEGWIEETHKATITDWDDATAARVTDWLAMAVEESCEYAATVPTKKTKKTKKKGAKTRGK